MSKFVKKPVEIDAVQWLGDWAPVMAWLDEISGGHWVAPAEGTGPIQRHDDELWLTTIHGEQVIARFADWVIAEPDRVHFYPCKPDIFAASYGPRLDDGDVPMQPSAVLQLDPAVPYMDAAGWRATAEEGARAYAAASSAAETFRTGLTEVLGIDERPSDIDLLADVRERIRMSRDGGTPEAVLLLARHWLSTAEDHRRAIWSQDGQLVALLERLVEQLGADAAAVSRG